MVTFDYRCIDTLYIGYINATFREPCAEMEILGVLNALRQISQLKIRCDWGRSHDSSAMMLRNKEEMGLSGLVEHLSPCKRGHSGLKTVEREVNSLRKLFPFIRV